MESFPHFVRTQFISTENLWLRDSVTSVHDSYALKMERGPQNDHDL